MKRVIILFIVFVLLTNLCGCGKTKEAIEDSKESLVQENKNEQPEFNTTEVSESKYSKEPTTSFEENQDLKIVASFVYDNDTYVVAENVGEQAILNFKIAYINFDKNGFTTTNDYKTGKAETVNLMPGEKNIFSWYGATGDYALSAITNVDYADGSTWETTVAQLDSWAKTARTNFSMDDYKESIILMKETGVLAETNDYVTLADFYIKHDNRFSAKHDFHFSVTNTSEQGITRLNVFVLEFDENGFPVNVNPYDTYCINGHMTGGNINLAAGQTGSYSDDLFLSPTTDQIKAAITHIEFQDGTEWDNPYIFEWIITNNNSY